jgi:hypothetical protein
MRQDGVRQLLAGSLITVMVMMIRVKNIGEVVMVKVKSLSTWRNPYPSNM